MNAQIYEEASDWIVRNRNGVVDAESRRLFDAWLRASPQNIEAYLEMSSIWERLGELDPATVAAEDKLSHLLDRSTNNVVQLPRPERAANGSVGAAPNPPAPSQASRMRTPAVALAASVLVALTGTWLFDARGTYETGIGEQRSIVLEDGSRIEMNSRSRLRVRYTDATRRVEMLTGQALFDVAKNRSRPFVVQSGSAQVRAVGTQFDVYRKDDGTVVTVVEGTVAVTPPLLTDSSAKGVPASIHGPRDAARTSAGELLIEAGEQVTVEKSKATTPRPTNVAAATAWTQRRLVFEAVPLIDVAAEFNRYNQRRIVIADPSISTLHVSGVFSSSDPQVLLRFLQAQSEIRVEDDGAEIRISAR